MPVSGHKVLAYGEENCFKHPSPSARHIFLHPGSHYWVFRILLQRGGWSASHPENLRAPPNLDGALVLLASVDQLVRQVSLLIEIKLQAARTWNHFFYRWLGYWTRSVENHQVMTRTTWFLWFSLLFAPTFGITSGHALIAHYYPKLVNLVNSEEDAESEAGGVR